MLSGLVNFINDHINPGEVNDNFSELFMQHTVQTRLSVSATLMPGLVHIRKTRPCNVYPPEPHFYIVKVGYAGVYLFFLFLLQNIDCGYSLEPPRRGGSNVYLQSMF